MKIILLQMVRYVVVASAIVAGIYALILARASQLFENNTAVSTAAAVHLQPRNSVYLDRLASWQSDNRKALLERSIAEDRFNYDAWIRLGLMAEMQDGDMAAAERCYRQAARVNHMFLPRWTLANFYFRQQKPDEFFHWTTETLNITPYASDPVFAQMWQMTQNEDVLDAAIPNKPRILLQYAWFLANAKQYGSIPRVVQRLVQLVHKNEAIQWGRDDLLAVSLDHMLEGGNLKPALEVWSTLKNAGWIDESIPTAREPLTNGDFRQPSFRHGLDWVLIDNPGSRVEQAPDLGQVRISLYGDEAEKITFLEQYVAVLPGAHYSATWQLQSEGLAPPSGMAWHLHAIGGAIPDIASGDLLSNGSWEFTAPATAKAFLLTLEYQRALGTVRARGALTLRAVSMQKK